MKKFLLLAIFTCFISLSFAQPPVVSWVKPLLSNANSASIGQSIAHDKAGNIYAAGVFSGTVNFDTGNSLSSSGGPYLVKYNSTGNFIWVKKIAGDADNILISADDSGNVYITGYFNGTVDFNPDNPGSMVKTSAGMFANIFIAKYAPNGTIEWVDQIAGSGSQFSIGIKTDNLGYLYVLGRFTGSTDFNLGSSSSISSVSNSNSQDIFMAKYNSNGGLIWINTIGGVGDDYPASLAADAAGNSYILGEFSMFDFDPNSNTANNLSGVCLAKYNTLGEYQWAKKFEGINNYSLSGADIATDGNFLYVTGSFTGTVDFNLDPNVNQKANRNSIGSDAFFAKYDAITASYQWANNIGGNGQNYAQSTSIAVNAIGEVYVLGRWEGTIDFDPTGNTNNQTAVGGGDIFFTKYNAAGNYQWMQGISGNASESGASISFISNKINIIGTYGNSINFDVMNMIPSNGRTNAFLAQYTDPAITLPVTLISFTAKAENNRVLVAWKTASELNNNHFEVQKSTDGKTFSTIAAQTGQGNSSAPFSYTAYDDKPNAGTNYYRLKQVDNNGTENFSEIKAVHFNLDHSDNTIAIYPNPGNGDFVNVQLDAPTYTIIELADLSGKIILSQKVNATGLNQLNLNGIAPGTYFISAKGNEKLMVKKFIKL
jgi:Secretion system C-terminal sorting domain